MKPFIKEKRVKYKPKNNSIFMTGVSKETVSVLQIEKSPPNPIIIKITYANELTPLYALIDKSHLNIYAKSLKFKPINQGTLYKRKRKNSSATRNYTVEDILTYEEL